ncbi:hypothetical protein BTUL_0064g00560 [Botrytis tulipae]|uniref:Transmembrane protein n=1 Tax=Botrytis tulipae TaxID=87230 RepID=A0A4Z1EN20_9HELO|nr:hypothetical protein BTUL_0064g00560 [Botrytis tulipae]
MPNTDHYILKRSGWLLLLVFTHLSASCLRTILDRTFLVADFENYPPSSYMCDHEHFCYHCRRKSQKWEERAKTEGIKTPFGTVLFKDEDEDEQTTAILENGIVGSVLAIGCAGLWNTRGVWGWWVVPTGLGLWATFFADFFWVLEKAVEKLEDSGMLDDDKESEEESEEDDDDDDDDDEDEDEDEDNNMLPSLLWVND